LNNHRLINKKKYFKFREIMGNLDSPKKPGAKDG